MPVPVCIVSGFLGAGKTTLVRRLLETPHGPRTGVILNEIGEAGIDAGFELSQAFVELKNRCACCVQGNDLQAAVDAVLATENLERIILETTGLADPLAVVWRLQAMAPRIAVEAVVTVVDPTAPATYPTREWQQQVAAADIIVVSKQELAPTPTTPIREHNAHARLIAPPLLADALLEGDFDLTDRTMPSFALLIAKHSDWRGEVITSDATHLLDKVEDWIDALPDAVFRAKGIVRTEGGFIGFQRVAGRTALQLDAKAPRHGQTRVAFFGPNIDAQALGESFRHTT